MSLYTDKIFIDKISYRLDMFRWTRDNVANFRCPLCGDSKKKSNKKRGYFVVNRANDDTYMYVCHNCCKGMSLGNFLKEFDNYVYREYMIEKFKGQPYSKSIKKKVKKKTRRSIQSKLIKVEKKSILDEKCIRIDNASDDNAGKQYVLSRLIPELHHKILYHAKCFKTVAGELDSIAVENLWENEPRLIIPFYDEEGELVAIQGRSYDPNSELRYITVKKSTDVIKIYGRERVNKNKPVLVVEGPIDSLFLPNCVASADGDLLTVQYGTVYIWDNTPRDINIVKKMEDAIKRGKRITIWNDCPWNGKDINEMILNGATQIELLEYIASHSYSGLTAKLHINNWRKI